MTGDPVYQQPSTALPAPARNRTRLLRQSIVQAESATHYEQTVGHIVRSPKSKFLQSAVNVQGAYFQIGRLVLTGADEPFHRGPFAEAEEMRLGCPTSNSRQQTNHEQCAQWRTHETTLGAVLCATQGQMTQRNCL